MKCAIETNPFGGHEVPKAPKLAYENAKACFKKPNILEGSTSQTKVVLEDRVR